MEMESAACVWKVWGWPGEGKAEDETYRYVVQSPVYVVGTQYLKYFRYPKFIGSVSPKRMMRNFHPWG